MADQYTLLLEGNNLTQLPVTNPKWSTAKMIVLDDNQIEVLDADKLPSTLKQLSIKHNNIKSIIGSFPSAFEYISLEGNPIVQLLKLPDTSLNKEEIADFFTFKTSIVYPENFGVWITVDEDSFTKEDIERYTIKQYTTKQYTSFLRTDKLHTDAAQTCEGINEGYISNILDPSSDDVVENVIFESTDLEIDIEGAFAGFTIHDNYIDLSLICSKVKTGGKIIRVLQDFAQRHPNIKFIDLDSVGSARKFYERMGFVYRRKPGNEMNPKTQLYPMRWTKQTGARRRKTVRRKRQ